MSRLKQHTVLTDLLPLLVDVAAMIVMALYLPRMSAPLQEPSGLNALELVFFYLLFCFGVYFTRKLRPLPDGSGWQPPGILINPKVRALFAFFFGLWMVSTTAYQIGYFESIQSVVSATLDEGDSSALLVYMPGALLGFSMLYILVLAFPIQDSVAPRSRSFKILASLSLLFTNGMLLFSSAQAVAFKALLAAPDGALVFAFAFIVLLLSFGPPRLLFQTKVSSVVAPFTLLLLVLFAAWQITVAA